MILIWNGSYADIKEAQDAIEFYNDCVNRQRLPYVLAVESKKTGQLIGDTGVNEVEGRVKCKNLMCWTYIPTRW